MLPELFHYLLEGREIINYDKFCKYHKCQYYIEWESSFDEICHSCNKIGKSNYVLQYPYDCAMLEDIKLEEERLIKKKMWQALNER